MKAVGQRCKIEEELERPRMLFGWGKTKTQQIPTAVGWSVGNRVLACRGDEDFYCPGFIAKVEKDRCEVVFTDGRVDWVAKDRMAPWQFQAGASIIGPPHPVAGEVRATVQANLGDMLFVQIENGPTAWIGSWFVRVPRPGAAPRQPQRMEPERGMSAVRGPESNKETDAADNAPISGLWAIGDRVLGRWYDLFWYPGTILAVDGDEIRVLFDDGDQRAIAESKLMPLVVEIGDEVFARPKDVPVLQYAAATITRIDGETVDLKYDEFDDGREELNSTLSRLRFWKSPVGSRELPFDEGDRIWAHDIDDFWYPAKITILDGDQVRVQFLDGPERLLTPERVKDFGVKVGDLVQARFRGGPQYYPGKVERVQGDEVEIHYDDGDKERTLVALVRRTRV
jgi:hypothetical protein